MEKEPNLISDIENFLRQQRNKSENEDASLAGRLSRKKIFSGQFIDSFFFSNTTFSEDTSTFMAKDLITAFDRWQIGSIAEIDSRDRHNIHIDEELILDMQAINELSVSDIRDTSERFLDVLKKRHADSISNRRVEEEMQLSQGINHWTFIVDVSKKAEKLKTNEEISQSGFGQELADEVDTFFKENHKNE